MGDKLPLLLKELRKEVHKIKLSKLMKLDRSDRMIMEMEVRSLINAIIRVQCVADSQCTVVLEMFEHMGGKIRTSEVK